MSSLFIAAKFPEDMVFFTQITMEAGEDGEYLDAMRKANIKGALVGVEAVTPEGLKAVFKDFNYFGEALARQLQTFKKAPNNKLRNRSKVPQLLHRLRIHLHQHRHHQIHRLVKVLPVHNPIMRMRITHRHH